MQTAQWHSDDGEFLGDHGFQLGLVFGRPEVLDSKVLSEVSDQLPGACVVGCTAGSFFHGGQLFEQGYTVSALAWENGEAHAESVPLDPSQRPSATSVGAELLKRGQPTGAIILWNEPSESAEPFLHELQQVLGNDCPIIGGMAADADFQFKNMAVYSAATEVLGVVVGLYGGPLKVNSSHATGLAWVGRTREISRTDGCSILEIDGERAVDALNRLGINMNQRPEFRGLASLQFVTESGEPSLVRTPLRIDEANGSLICGAPVHEGQARFLSFTDHEAILQSATTAAESLVDHNEDGFCLVVNCAARYSMLGPMWELELDYVTEALPKGTAHAGFYAYGEVAPLQTTGRSELHSQTITITSIS